jgi:hypothetical protein
MGFKVIRKDEKWNLDENTIGVGKREAVWAFSTQLLECWRRISQEIWDDTANKEGRELKEDQRPQTLKLIQERVGNTLELVGIGKNFLIETPAASN